MINSGESLEEADHIIKEPTQDKDFCCFGEGHISHCPQKT